MRSKYIWGITVLSMLGLATLGFGGNPNSSSCSCLLAYNDAWHQCRTTVHDLTLKHACFLQALSDYSACLATTTDSACL